MFDPLWLRHSELLGRVSYEGMTLTNLGRAKRGRSIGAVQRREGGGGALELYRGGKVRVSWQEFEEGFDRSTHQIYAGRFGNSRS